ncbi:hypothetical protein HDU76_010356, partial [Blyttiomyces sp. JEL0837]
MSEHSTRGRASGRRESLSNSQSMTNLLKRETQEDNNSNSSQRQTPGLSEDVKSQIPESMRSVDSNQVPKDYRCIDAQHVVKVYPNPKDYRCAGETTQRSDGEFETVELEFPGGNIREMFPFCEPTKADEYRPIHDLRESVTALSRYCLDGVVDTSKIGNVEQGVVR